MGVCSTKKQKTQDSITISHKKAVSQPQLSSVNDITPDPYKNNASMDLTPQIKSCREERSTRFPRSKMGTRVTMRKRTETKVHKQFSKLYTILKSLKNNQEVEQMLVQNNKTGQTYIMEVIAKDDTDKLAQYKWLRDQGNDNIKIAKVIDLFFETKATLAIKDYCYDTSLETIKGNPEQTTQIIVEIIELVKQLWEQNLNPAPLSLESFQYNVSGQYIKYINFEQFYVNQKQNQVPSESTLLQQIGIMSLELLTHQRINYENVQYEKYLKDMPKGNLDLCKFIVKLLSPINGIKTFKECLNEIFILDSMQTIRKNRLCQLFESFQPIKMNYLQFCILTFMVNKYLPEKVQLYEIIFQEADQDKNGSMSKEEFRKYCQKINQQGDIDKLFKEVDINEDGEIDFSEFLISIIDLKTILTKDNIKETFNELQAKGEFISLNSLQRKIRVDEEKLKICLKKLQFKRLFFQDYSLIVNEVVNRVIQL